MQLGNAGASGGMRRIRAGEVRPLQGVIPPDDNLTHPDPIVI